MGATATTTGRTISAAVIGLVTVAALGGCSLFRGDDGALPVPSRTAASATPDRTPSADPSAQAEQAARDRIAESASPRTPTTAPSEASAPEPTLSAIAPGTVVAEGDLASPKGSVHFHYRVVADAGDTPFRMEYSGFTSTLPVAVAATLLDTAPAIGDGITWHGVADHDLGGATTAPAAASSVGLDGVRTDPSGLGAIVTYSAAAPGQDVPVELGAGKVLAVQPVRWAVPARTTNVHPVDAGARPNATGTVSAAADGRLSEYRIAPDDLIGDVARRFGITVRDVVWLNPDVTVYGDEQYLYEGTTLNLDPLAR
jgi:hypothetical protein